MVGGSEPVSPLDSYADLAGRSEDRANAAAAAAASAAAAAQARAAQPPAERPADARAAPAGTPAPAGAGAHRGAAGAEPGAAAAAAPVPVPGNGGGGATALAASGAVREAFGSAPARLGGAQDLASALESASLSSGARCRSQALPGLKPCECLGLVAYCSLHGFQGMRMKQRCCVRNAHECKR